MRLKFAFIVDIMTSANMTSEIIAMVMPVRNLFASGYATAVRIDGTQRENEAAQARQHAEHEVGVVDEHEGGGEHHRDAAEEEHLDVAVHVAAGCGRPRPAARRRAA